MIQSAAGFFTYFVIMNDYGIRPGTLFGLGTAEGVKPAEDDVYDPSLPNRGNSNVGIKEKEAFDWTTDQDDDIDLRLFFYDKKPSAWSSCRWTNDAPDWWRRNTYADREI